METIDLDSLVGKLAEDVTKNDVALRWKNFSLNTIQNVDAQLENTIEEDNKLRDVLEVIVAALTNREAIVNRTLELECLQQTKFNKIVSLKQLHSPLCVPVGVSFMINLFFT